MGKRSNQPQFSKFISDFCKIVDLAKKEYEQNQSALTEMEGLTQDYLHELELGNLDYRARAKVATKLMECRKLRRACKDRLAVLEPLVSFVESDKWKCAINQLREVLGKTRKAEESQVNRSYRYRVLSEPKKNEK